MELHLVRSDISILLHHDSITGTSAPMAEEDWLRMISESDLSLRKIQWDLVEKLGRLQSMNLKVELDQISNRFQLLAQPMIRGEFQVSVFNPLPISRIDTVKVKVYSDNVEVNRILPNGERLQLNKTLVQTLKGNEGLSHYDMQFSVEMEPWEIATIIIKSTYILKWCSETIATTRIILKKYLHIIMVS